MTHKVLNDPSLELAQISWIQNQFNDVKEDSFNNYSDARAQFNALQSALVTTAEDLSKYRLEHLSKVGLNRLRTALRVKQSRSGNAKTKAVLISDSAMLDLDVLSRKGASKAEVLELAIKRLREQVKERDLDILELIKK